MINIYLKYIIALLPFPISSIFLFFMYNKFSKTELAIIWIVNFLITLPVAIVLCYKYNIEFICGFSGSNYNLFCR